MSSKICADSEKIWNLINELNKIKNSSVEQQEKLYQRSEAIKKRATDRIEVINGEIRQLKHNEGRKRSLLEEEKRKLQRLINCCEEDEKSLKQLISIYKKNHKSAKRQVNMYLKLIESMNLESDYEKYKEASPSKAGNYKGIKFRGTTFWMDDTIYSLDTVDDKGRNNITRMSRGMAPVGNDGLPVNLHHSIQRDTGDIIELTSTVHSKNHKAIHVNTHNIPSGINRDSFQALRSAYWKRKAAFIQLERGKQ